MSKSGIIVALGAIVLAMATISCKDDDDEEYLYLDGTLRFDLDAYIAPYTTLTLSPSGVTHPEGGDITYIWTTVPDNGNTSIDTVDVLVYTVSDTLQTYKFTCSAAATDYVTSSTTISTTVVRGGLDGTGSITDSLGNSILNLARLAYIVDDREGDSKKYYYTGFGGYDWFIHNLEYRGTELNHTVGVPYADCEVTNDVFGSFYSYDEALTACPDGWKLPTAEEWDSCIQTGSGSLMANVYFNGTKMWEYWPAVVISNNTYFSAIPVGEVNLEADNFSGVLERAVFWTATESDTDSSKAIVKYFMDDQPEVYEAYVDKASFGANVRCVRKGKSTIEF